MPIDRALNPDVLAALRAGRLYWGGRKSGKTTTLLTFIAVTWPVSKLGNGGPIVVTRDMRLVKWLRDYWKELFPDHCTPRFMSQNQNFEGLSGVLCFDEADTSTIPSIDGHYLMFGGGVSS